MNEMKQHILNVINSNSGIKEVQLAMRVMQYIDPSRFSDASFHHELTLLVAKNDVMMIEYTLPSISGMKRFYLPKGTEIK